MVTVFACKREVSRPSDEQERNIAADNDLGKTEKVICMCTPYSASMYITSVGHSHDRLSSLSIPAKANERAVRMPAERKKSRNDCLFGTTSAYVARVLQGSEHKNLLGFL